MAKITRSKTRVKGFENDEMDFQLMRQLGSTAYGGASVGECLSAAARITGGDPACWVEEFKKQAEWEQSDAHKRALKGHTVSAREQFFKACNSFRAAEYYTSPLDPLHRELGLKSRDCFIEAMKYVWHTFEETILTYKKIDIPVYIMSPSPEAQKRKTLLIVSGFDGTLEEEYLMRGYPAIERGYNVVHYSGPGQMDLYRFFSNTHFEPDFENVTKTVLDFIYDRPEIDQAKLALMGISVGGYFSTRSAGHEPRIKALIPNSPILNLHDYMSAFIGYDAAEIPDDRNFSLENIPNIPDDIFPPEAKSRTVNLMVRFGQPTFRDTFVYLREFTVGDAIMNIKCPCLALEGAGEGGEPEKQFNEFAEKVSGPVTKYQFTEFEGADTHCQVSNPSYAAAVAMDWLDEILD
ncbi:MAG: alpha/beta hydrolase family protein [Thermodesulfobacteriota bacterium]